MLLWDEGPTIWHCTGVLRTIKYDESQNSLKVRDNIFYDFVKFIPPYFILGGLFHLFMGEIL